MASSEGQEVAPSVAEKAGTTKPRVIPSNQLVILREADLECDLATAIQRVREDEKTSGSRILIVGPDEDAKGRVDESAALPMPLLPMSIGQVARRGGLKALRGAGQRLAPKLSSLDGLFAEISRSLDDVDEAAREGTLARLHSRIRVAGEILGWLRATADDLQNEVDGMVGGFQAVDVYDLLSEVQGQVESFFPELRVNVAPADGEPTCWGRATDLTEGLFLAIVLTAHRIGGKGAVNVEAQSKGENVVVRILGLGEPAKVRAPQETIRLREIFVGQHRGRIVPDSMGPFGTGVVLELPVGP